MTEPGHDKTTERSYRKPLVMGAVGVVIVIAMVVGAGALAERVAGNRALNVDPGIAVTIEIPAGSSARQIAAAMEDAGVVRASELQSVISDQGIASQLQAGTYNLETRMAPEDVVRRLLTGPDAGTGSSVIVYEGQDVRSIIAALADQTGFPAAEFEDALEDGAVTSPLMPATFSTEVDALTRWEGLLFPARYELPEGATPADILTAMADETVKRVAGVDWSRLDELGVSRYEALIVASLIQREAGVEADRPLIASVIYNRLEQDIPLQIDATVIYALGENPGRVLAKDLEVDSPWNTYRVKGLPPTPIGTAQMESIEAAADPATTEYLFYVLVSKDGRHGFSRTYEEHQMKIAKAKADGVLP